MMPHRRSRTGVPDTDDGLSDINNLSLAKRVRSGITWNVSSSLIGQSIGFIRSIVLARLLAPEDFGIVGMALTIVAAGDALTTIGLDQTVIATKFDTSEELKAHLDTVWSTEIVRSLVIAVLVSACALPISRFYGQVELLRIIPLLGLGLFIRGFKSVGMALLRKKMSFRKIFCYEMSTSVAGVVLTICLAAVLQNLWALVIGLFLTAAVETLLSYVFHPYRPRLAFEKVAFDRAAKVGKFVLLAAASSYVMSMADNVIVGHLLGAGALGNYSLAYNIASAPISILVFALGGVLFPAYSEITLGNRDRLDHAFSRVFTISLLMLVTIAGPCSLLADDIVLILFGDRWVTAGRVLRILALGIPLRGVAQMISTLFFSLNKPKPMAVGRVVEAVVLLVLLYLLTGSFGLVGTAWAVVLTLALACMIRLVSLNRVLPGISLRLCRAALSVLLAAGVGWLLARFGITFLTSPLARVMLGGLIAMLIPLVILLASPAGLRKGLTG